MINFMIFLIFIIKNLPFLMIILSLYLKVKVLSRIKVRTLPQFSTFLLFFDSSYISEIADLNYQALKESF